MSDSQGMTPGDFEPLLDAARAVRGLITLEGNADAGSVASALLAANGTIYTGICIDMPCGIGFCAEHAAIAEMLKDRQTRMLASVAINKANVLPPCGRCRELMAMLNHENDACQILVAEDHVMTLAELLPMHWVRSKQRPR